MIYFAFFIGNNNEILSRNFYLVLKSMTIVQVYIPMTAIGYKYNPWKVLILISSEGVDIIVTGKPCLSRYPDHFSSVVILPVICSCVFGSHFNVCNSIDWHNKIWQYGLVLETIVLYILHILELGLQ